MPDPQIQKTTMTGVDLDVGGPAPVRVEIHVVNGAIHVHQPVVAIYRRGMEEPPPVLAREVEWVADGLAQGERLVVDPKPGSSRDVFDVPRFEMRPDDNARRSGRAKKTENDPHEMPWNYEIVLHGPDGRERGRLDPTVVIKDYP